MNNNFGIKRLAELLAAEIQVRYGIDAIEAVCSKIEEMILADDTPDKFDRYSAIIKNKAHNEDWQKIIEKITIHESYFQRNENILNGISKVVDDVIASKKGLRIWSIPCATGEEAYDLAFIAIERIYYKTYGTTTLNDKLLADLQLDDVFIYGTDISETSLRKAKTGKYSDIAMGSLRKLDPLKARYFFDIQDNYFEVKPFVKRLVKFAPSNAVRPPLQTDFDIILCRNMLIYFGDEQKKLCQENLAKALSPGGYLFLGSVDPFLLDADDFIQGSDGHSLWYQKKKG